MANTTYGYVNVTVSNCGTSASSGITAYPSGVCNQSAIAYSYYPNPANTMLTVQITDSLSENTYTAANKTLDGTYQLNLHNSFAQPIYSTQSSEKEIKIPLEGIPDGVYYLNLIYKDAVLRKQVIIKK